MTPELRRYRDCPVPQADALAIVTLVNSIWTSRSQSLEQLARPLMEGVPSDRPHREILAFWEGSRVVAHATTFGRKVLCADERELPVLALGGVCVDAGCRGQGLGARIVREAFGRVDDGTFPFCLYQTAVPEFYRKLGAVEVFNPFTNHLAVDPAKRPWWDPCVMVYPAGSAWPSGPIDLNGNAF